MPADKELFKKYPNPVFVETGSNFGEGIQLAIEAGFKDIYSIELDPIFYKHCTDRFKDVPIVHLILGDSNDRLGELLKIIGEPITFWLDAHYSYGYKKGEKISPLLEEIEAIGRHHIKNHIIMIDDLRDWSIGDHGFDTAILKQKISLINNKYAFKLEDGLIPDDILVATLLE